MSCWLRDPIASVVSRNIILASMARYEYRVSEAADGTFPVEKTAKLMVFKLVNAAAKTWRRLRGENQLPKVVQGVKFGIEVIKMPAHHAA
jgi:hypothetical protein